MNSRVLQNRWEYGRLRRRNLLWSIALALLLIVAFFTLFVQVVRVVDTGMSPTLRVGDVVLFNRLSHFMRMPTRGSVYLLRDAETGDLSLGRIIGLPGETVAVDNGNVYINGIYLSETAYAQYATADMEGRALGKGEFFLLPDNRGYMKLDPEAMVYTAGQLLGEAMIIVSPLSRLGIF